MQFFAEEKNGTRSTRVGSAQFAKVFCCFFSKKQAFS
jgi:hypothetical protein